MTLFRNIEETENLVWIENENGLGGTYLTKKEIFELEKRTSKLLLKLEHCVVAFFSHPILGGTIVLGITILFLPSTAYAIGDSFKINSEKTIIKTSVLPKKFNLNDFKHSSGKEIISACRKTQKPRRLNEMSLIDWKQINIVRLSLMYKKRFTNVLLQNPKKDLVINIGRPR
jgi:hypothetical protein